MIKKQALVLCILSLFLLVSLTSCIVIPKHKTYQLDADTVSSVQIYDMGKPGYSLDPGSLSYAVEDERLEEFLDDLSEIPFSDVVLITVAAVDPGFSFGRWVIRINQTDGSYMLLSNGGYGETRDANGNVIDSNHYGCDKEEWNSLISKYLPQASAGTQIRDDEIPPDFS